MQRHRGIVGRNRESPPQQDRAGIQPRFHLHDANTRRRIARQQGALNRRRTTPTGQQRSVDVEAAKSRHIEHHLRQDQAISRHHHHLGAHGRNFFLCYCILQTERLKNLNPFFQRQFLDRRSLQRHTAPGRTIRLTQHQSHFVAGIDNRLQGLRGKLGRPGKNQLHAVTRDCLTRRDLILTCLSCDR